MKDAGFNIIKEHKLLPDEVIAELEPLPKKDRNIKIGKLRYKYKTLKEMDNWFTKYRIMFAEANNLHDEDILSVKKDAIFVKKYCYVLEFDELIKFVEKNIYSAYLYIDEKKLEFYYNKTDIHVKGISNEVLSRHEGYLLVFVKEFIRRLSQDDSIARRYLIEFINSYKKRQLSIGYYRQFDQMSLYKIIVGGKLVDAENVEDISICDISYNYMNIIVPLLDMVM